MYLLAWEEKSSFWGFFYFFPFSFRYEYKLALIPIYLIVRVGFLMYITF